MGTTSGTAEFGNGTTTVHQQITAGALGTTVERIAIRRSDTDVVRHDTAAFGSTGTGRPGGIRRARGRCEGRCAGRFQGRGEADRTAERGVRCVYDS